MLISVDPGLKTGICVLLRHGDTLTLLSAAELHWLDAVTAVDRIIASQRIDAIVGEKFTITPQTAMNSQAPWSLCCLGCIEWLCHTNGIKFSLQAPAAAKSFCTNENIRAMGLWYKGGKGHALDAIRHGVLYYATLGFVPPSLLASKVTNT